MATKIYISYRAGHEEKLAKYIHHYFADNFGDDSVFFDPLIKTEQAFPSERSNAIRDADVVLVLIDKSWGIEALHDADDWIRIEIQQALLSEKLTIPVILGDMPLLQPEDLPLNLQNLLYEEELRVGDSKQIKHQLARLARRFQSGVRKKKVTIASRSNLIITLVGFFLVIASIGFLIFALASLLTPQNASSVSELPTLVLIPTSTPTSTITPTPIPTDTPTNTPTLTLTPTNTLIPTSTPTSTITPTPMPTNTTTPIPLRIRENGTHIVFSRGSQFSGPAYLYIRDLNTGEERQLTDLSAALSMWSPDGSEIVFVAMNPDTNIAEIYVINADGTNLRNLSQSPTGASYPAWSPDGRQIAFTTDSDGNSEIYVMNADGTNLRNVTQHGSDDYDASWSPDGSQLVFTSTRLDRVEIFIIDIDGTNLRNLSQTPDADEMSPSWSPDGTQILFGASRNDAGDIFLINADGSHMLNLTTTSDISDGFPSWSPDGTQIIFQSDRDAEQRGFDIGALEIYIMNRNGSNVRRLTNNNEDDWEADWRPAP